MDFYNSLNYSFGNEDWHVEAKALNVQPGDTVLCVTASGDRPLHLLLTPCQKVISIDLNHSQTALLELKIAAYNHFDYEKCLSFFGCKAHDDRLTLYKEIQSDLSLEAKSFWDAHLHAIKSGVIYQGKTEQLCQLAARFLNLTRKKKNLTLLAFQNIENQRHYIKHTWDSWGFRKVFEMAFHPLIFKMMSNDPGITAYREYTNQPGKYIYNKMLAYLQSHLAKESALLQLIYTGTVNHEGYLPYLTYEGYEVIRKRLNAIEFHTTNIIDYLQNVPPSSFNCYSLSDIASYMPQSAFEKLLAGIHQSAIHHARFCMRELFSKRIIPENFATIFKRDNKLEADLEKEESNFVYRFIVGQIIKN